MTNIASAAGTLMAGAAYVAAAALIDNPVVLPVLACGVLAYVTYVGGRRIYIAAAPRVQRALETARASRLIYEAMEANPKLAATVVAVARRDETEPSANRKIIPINDNFGGAFG